MKKSIHGAVFTLLLAFAAPVPLAESLTGQEQESVFAPSRPSRSAARYAWPQSPPKAARADVAPLPPAPPPVGAAPLDRIPEDWIPPILSRPPPL